MCYDRAKLICPSMEPIDGKTGESVPIFTFTIYGDKATTSYDRSLFIRLCYSLWLFHLHSVVKIQPFSPVFPLAGATTKAFCRLILWNFKEKSINHFL